MVQELAAHIHGVPVEEVTSAQRVAALKVLDTMIGSERAVTDWAAVTTREPYVLYYQVAKAAVREYAEEATQLALEHI